MTSQSTTHNIWQIPKKILKNEPKVKMIKTQWMNELWNIQLSFIKKENIYCLKSNTSSTACNMSLTTVLMIRQHILYQSFCMGWKLSCQALKILRWSHLSTGKYSADFSLSPNQQLLLDYTSLHHPQESTHPVPEYFCSWQSHHQRSTWKTWL